MKRKGIDLRTERGKKIYSEIASYYDSLHYGWKGNEEYLFAEGYNYLIDFNGKVYTFNPKERLINNKPLYLIYTSNQKIAKKYVASKGRSLFYNNTVYVGFMMNIYNSGTVTDDNGNTLFVIKNITKTDRAKDYIRICTNTDIYEFAV